MDRRITVLAIASFAMGTEAYVYAGHLETLAAEIGQSVANAGQLATAFAVTYGLSAPFVASASARLNRRTAIVVGLILIGVLNFAAAAVTSFEALLAVRIACGLAAGLVGPTSSLAAAELASPEQRGRAMARVIAGLTLAFILGIPTGSVIGDFFGWRGTFAYAGTLALFAALAVRFVLPSMPGSKRKALGIVETARLPMVMSGLTLTLIGFASTFATIAYIGPVVTDISGLTGSGIGAMQVLIGFGSVIGVVLGGRNADRPSAGRVLVVGYISSVISLGSYSVLMLTTAADPGAPLLTTGRASVILILGAAMLIGAAALFARIPIIQARLVHSVPPEGRGVVLALNGSMVFLGQGLGAVIGGATIATFGLSQIGFVAALTALLGAVLAIYQTRNRSFLTPPPVPAE